MERKAVASSVIISFGYDRDSGTLEIEFKHSGEVYQYEQVPSAVYEELRVSESKGIYFNQKIKGKYKERHLEREKGK
jgi:hypothetical protein